MCVYMYIYIYIEREREREREKIYIEREYIHKYTHRENAIQSLHSPSMRMQCNHLEHYETASAFVLLG